MKFILAFLNNPLVVLLHSFLGAGLIAYTQNVALEAIYWFIPCIFIIIADLVAGVNAAKQRGEQVRFSGATRRTVNKCVCYLAWIMTCVTLNERYETEWIGWVGMGMVFFIEGLSFVSNLIEPHGYKVSVHGVLRTIGKKHNIEGLEDVVTKDKKDEGDGTEGQEKI